MSKNRYIDTHFWKDTYTSELDPSEKLLFLYCLTNPNTTICGAYEIRLKEIALDTGFELDTVKKILQRFEDAAKIYYQDGWLYIRNFIKHQKLNPNIEKGIANSVNSCPDWIKEKVLEDYGKPLKGFERLSKALNYLNTNLNINLNTNLNTNPPPASKIEKPKIPEIKKGVYEPKNNDSESFQKQSRFNYEQRLEYANFCKRRDGIIKSPEAVARTSLKTGNSDGQIKAYFDQKNNKSEYLPEINQTEAQKRLNCERCFGTNLENIYSPEGKHIGTIAGKQCDHRPLEPDEFGFREKAATVYG